MSARDAQCGTIERTTARVPAFADALADVDMNTNEAFFAVENYFHIGAYDKAIEHVAVARASTSSGMEELALAVFEARSNVALGRAKIVIDSTSEDAPMPLRAVKLLARYTVGENAEGIVQEITAMTEDMNGSQDATVQLMAATILSREGNVVDAMKCCHTGLSLELNAMMVNLLCMIDRPELAEKQAKMMQAVDDDSTIVQLACAWAHVASGGKKIQDASYIYQELGDKFAWTPKLHNGSAVCYMLMGAYDDAERELLEAIGKDAKNAETLANLATCAAHLGKSSSRFINAIKALGVPSDALAKIEGYEGDFARAAAAVANA